KLITLAALFIFGICSVHAQTNSIKGILIDDADKRPVRGVSVSLLLRKDSAKVKNTVSDSAGHFSFTDLSPDSFMIMTNAVVYQEYISFVFLKDTLRDLGILSMTRQGK